MLDRGPDLQLAWRCGRVGRTAGCATNNRDGGDKEVMLKRAQRVSFCWVGMVLCRTRARRMAIIELLHQVHLNLSSSDKGSFRSRI